MPSTHNRDQRNQRTDFCHVVRIGAFDRVVRLIYCWWFTVCGVLVDHGVDDIGTGGFFSVEAHSISNQLCVRGHVYEIESRADGRSDRTPFVAQEPWRTGVLALR